MALGNNLDIAVQRLEPLVELDRAQQTTLETSGVTIVLPAGSPAVAGSGEPALTAPSGAFIP